MSTARTTGRNRDIPSLTGLRFFAAASILANHLLLGIMPAAKFPETSAGLAACGILGMNLFFVLSGFIIHYNYGVSLRPLTGSGIYKFLTARIARLWPLLFVFIIFEYCTEEYLWSSAVGGPREAHARALPFFLTFTQTWWYTQMIPGMSLAYAFQNASITWSISTEFLMYLLYPLILFGLLWRNESFKSRLGKTILLGGLLALGMRWLHAHQDMVDAFGIRHWGPMAGLKSTGSHSFAVWFLFLSPYMRIGEFCIGALCAHLYAGAASSSPGRLERGILTVLTPIAVASILASMLPAPWTIPALASWHKLAGYFPAIAIIIYGCARGSGQLAIARLLAWRPFVWAGEASYSLYLIHIVFYNRFRVEPTTYGFAVLRAIATFSVILLVARVLFECLEDPARRGMRALFQRLQSRGNAANQTSPSPNV